MFELLTGLPAPGGADAAAAYSALALWRRPEDALIDWDCMPPACDPCHHLDKAPAERARAAGALQNTGLVAAVAALSLESAAASSSLLAGIAAETPVQPQSSRGWLKRHQVDSFMILLCQLLRDPLRSYHIVDFGCGSGGLLLPLAALLPHCTFTGIDYKPAAVVIMRQRAAAAGLTNVRGVVGMIEAFDERFDVGVALHACGNATDHALLQCVRYRAAYIANPCCVGKLKFSVAGGSSFSAVRKVFAGRVPSFIVSDDLAPTHPHTKPHKLPPTLEAPPITGSCQKDSDPHAPSQTQPPTTTSTTTTAEATCFPSPAATVVSQPTPRTHPSKAATCCPVTEAAPFQVSSSSSCVGGGGGSSCGTAAVPSPQETDSGGSSSGGVTEAEGQSKGSSGNGSLLHDETSNAHQAKVIMQRVAAEGERRHASSKPEKSLLQKLMRYCSQPPAGPATSTQTLTPSLLPGSAAAAVAGCEGGAGSAGADAGSSAAENGGGGCSSEPHALQHPRSLWMRTHLTDPVVNFAVLAKGYLVALTRVLHDELQAKGDLLVGVPSEAALWAHVHSFLK
ncbi:MAG: hypothetical protein WDW38_004181 [Sanguina aurantia]